MSDLSVSLDRVTRFEVIDHRGQVRALVARNVVVEFSLQDDGRTLKVFLTSRVPETREP